MKTIRIQQEAKISLTIASVVCIFGGVLCVLLKNFHFSTRLHTYLNDRRDLNRSLATKSLFGWNRLDSISMETIGIQQVPEALIQSSIYLQISYELYNVRTQCPAVHHRVITSHSVLGEDMTLRLSSIIENAIFIIRWGSSTNTVHFYRGFLFNTSLKSFAIPNLQYLKKHPTSFHSCISHQLF